MKQFARKLYARLPFKRQAYAFVRHKLGVTPPFFQHLHFTGPFELALSDGKRVTIHSDGNVLENELFWLGLGRGWEGKSLAIWERICVKQHGAILDIGANSGIYALIAAAVAPDAQVIGFEPLARIAEHFRRNVEINGFDIGIEQQAVSNADGTTIIFDATDVYNYSASLEGQGPDARAVTVPVCSIDAYAAAGSLGPVMAIKIDIERHEPSAIAGMVRTLAKDRPPVLIEILDDEIGAAVEGHIAGLDYLMFHVLEAEGLELADRLSPQGGHNWNHLLCTAADYERLRLADFLVGEAGVREPAV